MITMSTISFDVMNLIMQRIYLQNSATFEFFGVIDDSNFETIQPNSIIKSIDVESETFN
jgi:hypothetical protein